MFTPEILSPVGDRERLEAAIRYGADAVYLGGDIFGMRAAAGFDAGGLRDAVSYAHERGVKVYLTCNTLPTNAEIPALPDFLGAARDAGVDALIVADVGILMLAKKLVPSLAIHISTQAGIVNYLSAAAFYELGAARVVLARELSLEQIREIRDRTPPTLELETFVHGAMCMSVSGRCLLSSYLTGRDANRGECAQPCRWGYHLTEEKRRGQHYPIYEDERGSYILNARDLCMVEHIGKLIDAGVSSLKIEGRAKSAYYVATVTAAYRGALDAYLKNPAAAPPAWVSDEVRKVSHREYSTGFYFGTPEQFYKNGGYIRDWDIVAVVEGYEDGCLAVTARNKFSRGELLEIMIPRGAPLAHTVDEIRDSVRGEIVEHANRPMRRYLLPYPTPLPTGAMVRRETTGAGDAGDAKDAGK